MQKILNYLKKSNFDFPIFIGKPLAKIPFKYRPGISSNYKKQQKSILTYSNKSIDEQKEYIFKMFYRVFEHAYLNIPFYTNLYKSNNITLNDINNFDDIKKIPIITKKDLLNVPINERSYPIKNRLITNTGGSTGKSFYFYIDPRRYGNEWAHIHHMWSKLNYKPNNLKISFDGRSSVKDFIQYDVIRNSLKYDIYADPINTCNKLKKISNKYEISYLHGYPSAIYNFACYCKENQPILLERLQKSLKGVFLSSEFPSPLYRNFIEKTFNVNTQSFYGHTETCVMAYEESNFLYNVFQTYGHAEAVNTDNSKTHLIGTSYFNFASPLIRYDTEDLIDIVDDKDGILNVFKIKEGRKGDFIIDKFEKNISLTGLIFGRHHKLFNLSKHIQISQSEIGKATIYYISNKVIPKIVENNLFDTSNIDIDFTFKRLDKPFKTISGKINLLIKENK